MTNHIVQAWESGRCPIINGIFLPSDEVMLLDGPLVLPKHNSIRIALQPAVSLTALAPATQIDWTNIDVVCRAESPSRDYNCVAGDGAMGGDGFIAVLDA